MLSAPTQVKIDPLKFANENVYLCETKDPADNLELQGLLHPSFKPDNRVPDQ